NVRQHVIEKTDARVQLGLATAIQRQLQPDIGLRRLPVDRARPLFSHTLSYRPRYKRSARNGGKSASVIRCAALSTSYSWRTNSNTFVSESKSPNAARASPSRGCPMDPGLMKNNFPSPSANRPSSSTVYVPS